MSSDRIERKRKSEFDTSDNSADELPAVKIRKLDSAKSISNIVSEACKKIFNWITPEFVKKMAVRVSHQRSSSSLRMGAENSYRNQHPIDLEDDDNDEECTVVGMQNGTGALSRSASADTLEMDSQSKSTRPKNSSISPRTSTPSSCLLSPDNPYYKKVSQIVDRKKVNGCPVGAETGEVRRSRRSEKCIAPITNPRSEIDILLEKDQDIEIINEVYPAKHSSGPTRKIRLLSESRSARSDRTSSISDLINNSAHSPYVSRSYTANEVVRLQEKAQYSLLLEKVVKRVPLFQPAFPKEASQTSAIQVDLTEEKDLSGAGCHFKKEKVSVNVNDFLNKYYKPCTLVSRAAKMESRQNHTQSVSKRDTSKEEEDDDIQIIEYPDLPKLKPRKSSVKREVFFSDGWIAEMKMSMICDTEKMLQNISANEDKVQRFKKRREARNAEEMRKREEQRLAGFIFPEDIEMEEEALPEITPEMDEVIERAFLPGHPDEKLSEIRTSRESHEVKRVDVATLSHLNWLNDQVINFYMGLIESRSEEKGYPTAYCFTSFFYPKVKKEGISRSLLRWTRRTEIFLKDLLIVPLHLDLHWALLVVDNRTKVMKYYDSMGPSETIVFKTMEQYLMTEMRENRKAVLAPNTYSFEIPKDNPKQMNGSDCGMFTLKYAEYISRDAPLTFTQENMPYFRRRMVYEIMTGRIL